MGGGGGVYEAREGLTWRSGLIILLAVVAVWVTMQPGTPVWARVVGFVLFGIGGLITLVQVLLRRVAFRVDGEGVTLGRPLLGRGRAAGLVPWADITSVVTYKQRVGFYSIRYIGLQRQAGAAPLPESGSPFRRLGAAAGRALLPHVPGDVLMDSRPVITWRLDRGRLEEALAVYAPNVPLIDLN